MRLHNEDNIRVGGRITDNALDRPRVVRLQRLRPAGGLGRDSTRVVYGSAGTEWVRQDDAAEADVGRSEASERGGAPRGRTDRTPGTPPARAAHRRRPAGDPPGVRLHRDGDGADGT